MRKERTILSQPVNLESLKEWLFITTGDFDDILALCLSSAVAEAETLTGLTLAPSRYVVTAPFSRVIKPDIHRVSSVESVAVDGTAIPLEEISIDNDTVALPDSADGAEVVLTLNAGPEFIDPDIRAAILMIAAAHFNNPADSVESLPKASTNILMHHRYYNV